MFTLVLVRGMKNVVQQLLVEIQWVSSLWVSLLLLVLGGMYHLRHVRRCEPSSSFVYGMSNIRSHQFKQGLPPSLTSKGGGRF